MLATAATSSDLQLPGSNHQIWGRSPVRSQNQNQSFVNLLSALSLAADPDDEDEDEDDENSNDGKLTPSSGTTHSPDATSADHHQLNGQASSESLTARVPVPERKDSSGEEDEIEKGQTNMAIEDMRDEAGAINSDLESGKTDDSEVSLAHQPKPLDDVQKALKLGAIEDEFGPWLGSEGESAEEFVADLPAAIYRSVLVKGALLITSKRILFIAYLPEYNTREPIMSGPATVVMPERLRHKKVRVWAELYYDSVAMYPDSTKLYRPISSRLLSSISPNVDAIDPAHPNQFKIKLKTGQERTFILDTQEAAMEWRGKLMTAMFAYSRSCGKLRVSIPIDRVITTTIQSFIGYAQQFSIKFDSGTNIPRDRRATRTSVYGGLSRQSSSASTIEDLDADGLQDVAFGFLNRYSWVNETIQSLLKSRGPFTTEKITSPPPVVDTEENEGSREEDKLQDAATSSPSVEFKSLFSLGDEPDALHITKCELVRTIPASGRLCISSEFLCFYRKCIGSRDIKIRLPLSHIHSVGPGKIFGFHVYGLVIRILGQADVWFEFHSKHIRDDIIHRLRKALSSVSSITETIASPPPLSPQRTASDETTVTTRSAKSGLSKRGSIDSTGSISRAIFEDTITQTENDCGEPRVAPSDLHSVPHIVGVDRSRVQISKRHFVCMTIGSRGDVQPYIALCKELMKDGHRCTIASHPEYEDWCRGFGIGYKPIGGDPAALMKLSTEHSFFSVGFFKESLGKFRQWMDDLLMASWEAAQDADVLIESPSTMAGIHVAEALQIPYIRAFTMCWTPTSAYPHAFAVPPVEMGPSYNQMTYSLFESILWKATSGQINRWRLKTLGLQKTDLTQMEQSKVPFIYNFSAAVVPRPNDWGDRTCISGYWFLDNPDSKWTPPADLLTFLADAKSDGVPVIYVGFGSIVLDDPVAVQKNIYDAIQMSKVRAIVSAGWSGRLAKKGVMPDKPDGVYLVDSIPHDWLFPQIAAACHHGGAGSTGASLRAGIVTMIRPFFGDQFFWTHMVTKLGAGVRVSSLHAKDLADAFTKSVTDRVLREKAQIVGAKIRQENGVHTAPLFTPTSRVRATPRG